VGGALRLSLVLMGAVRSMSLDARLVAESPVPPRGEASQH
jgi:hypothetical protein